MTENAATSAERIQDAATRGWLAPNATPTEKLLAHHAKFVEAVEEYVTADLEARDAGRRRVRALDLMRQYRWEMKQIAAQHGLPVPESRFAHLLDVEGPQ